MADKGLSKQEKQRLKEKEKFERERAQWKKQEARKRTMKTRSVDRTAGTIRVIAIVVAAIVVLGLVSIYAGSYGIPGRFMPALTVGGQNIPTPEWAFNFSNLYRSIYPYGMYYGMDTNSSLFGQPTQDGSTWDATLTTQVHQSLQNEIAIYSEAKKAGHQLSGEEREALETTMREAEEMAAMYAMSVNAYLRNNYVPGITKSRFRALEERKLTVQSFIMLKQEEFRALHTADELQEKYDADPGAYNQVDYRAYAFAKDIVEAIEGEGLEETVARQLAADQAALAKAEDFLRQGGTQAGFIAAAKALYDEAYAAAHDHGEDEELDHDHDDADAYDADASTLNMRRRRADIAGEYASEEFAEWFFEAARRAGDTKAWETDTMVYAVLLVKPSYAQTTVDFYTINVDPPPHQHAEGEECDEDEATPQELARQSAEELYAQWQENGGTREAFVELVKEQVSIFEAQDEGAEPGLSENMVPGDSGYAELDAWAFDDARQAGEAAVIETAENFKLVYLASRNDDSFAWQSEIEEELVNEDYVEYVEALQKEYPLGYHGWGLRVALASARKMCDEFMEYMRAQNTNNYDFLEY